LLLTLKKKIRKLIRIKAHYTNAGFQNGVSGISQERLRVLGRNILGMLTGMFESDGGKTQTLVFSDFCSFQA